MAQQHYRLPLGDRDPHHYAALAGLISTHRALFGKFVMAAHPDDIRYAWQPETFEITDIDARCFRFRCLVHYFEPCADRDMHDPHSFSVPYRIEDGELLFTLDETPWRVA